MTRRQQSRLTLGVLQISADSLHSMKRCGARRESDCRVTVFSLTSSKSRFLSPTISSRGSRVGRASLWRSSQSSPATLQCCGTTEPEHEVNYVQLVIPFHNWRLYLFIRVGGYFLGLVVPCVLIDGKISVTDCRRGGR